MDEMEQPKEQEKQEARIIISLGPNGAVTPEFEGVSPFMAPVLLRKVANMIEDELTKSR